MACSARAFAGIVFGWFVSVSTVMAQTASVPLRNSPSAVVGTYAQLSTMAMAQRHATFGALPAPMKEDVWSLHLQFFLEDHPDLSSPERAVLLEALGFFASGALETDRSAPAWAARVEQPLRELEQHARSLASPQLVVRALTELGVPEPVRRLRLVGNARLQNDFGDILDCECSTSSNYCCFLDCATSPTPTCRRPQQGQFCAAQPDGCGFGWMYPCNGICGP